MKKNYFQLTTGLIFATSDNLKYDSKGNYYVDNGQMGKSLPNGEIMMLSGLPVKGLPMAVKGFDFNTAKVVASWVA